MNPFKYQLGFQFTCKQHGDGGQIVRQILRIDVGGSENSYEIQWTAPDGTYHETVEYCEETLNRLVGAI